MTQQELALKLLRRLEAQFRALEMNTPLGENFDEGALKEIKELLAQTLEFDQPEIHKLAKISDHLKPSMGHRELLHFLVPIERALERNLRDPDFLILDRDIRPASERKSYPLCLMLDHWRSAFNVGSVFRSAEGLGVQKIILTGYSPRPDSDKTAKAALGAEKLVSWEHFENPKEAIENFKQQGYRVIALETTTSALPLDSAYQAGPTVFLLGNERFGLGKDLLDLCDEVRILPLGGVKNSLNAGVIAAIATYEWRRQFEGQKS